MPWGPLFSNHPWSREDVKILANWYGALRVPWDLRGARNHIVAMGQCHKGRLRSGDLCLSVVEFWCHPIIKPIIVTVSGRSFRWSGRNGWSRGAMRDQFRAAPATTAIKVRAIIGLVVEASSSLI